MDSTTPHQQHHARSISTSGFPINPAAPNAAMAVQYQKILEQSKRSQQIPQNLVGMPAQPAGPSNDGMGAGHHVPAGPVNSPAQQSTQSKLQEAWRGIISWTMTREGQVQTLGSPVVMASANVAMWYVYSIFHALFLTLTNAI